MTKAFFRSWKHIQPKRANSRMAYALVSQVLYTLLSFICQMCSSYSCTSSAPVTCVVLGSDKRCRRYCLYQQFVCSCHSRSGKMMKNDLEIVFLHLHCLHIVYTIVEWRCWTWVKALGIAPSAWLLIGASLSSHQEIPRSCNFQISHVNVTRERHM